MKLTSLSVAAVLGICLCLPVAPLKDHVAFSNNLSLILEQSNARLRNHSQSKKRRQPKKQASFFEGSWCFWFKRNDNTVSDECYFKSKKGSAAQNCRASERSWRKQTGFAAISFPCMETSKKNLKIADEQCKVGKEYSCSLRDRIKSMLNYRSSL